MTCDSVSMEMRAEALRLRARADYLDRAADSVDRRHRRIDAERSGQLWLGRFIEILRTIPCDALVSFDDGAVPGRWNSYRGNYADLALEDTGVAYPTAKDVFLMSEAAIARPFPGWKGGLHNMTEDTVLWRASYGGWSGRPIVAVEDREGWPRRCVILTGEAEG